MFLGLMWKSCCGRYMLVALSERLGLSAGKRSCGDKNQKVALLES